MSNTIEIRLDCGCAVTLRQEWEHGCAGDCHPAVEVIAAGEITAPCALHTPREWCPYDCSVCHDPYDCECPNCERVRG